MIFWVSLFVITVTTDWLIVNASTKEELFAAVLGIIAMIMILVYFAR